MAISPMASRAMALSYSRLDRLVQIDTLGCRTIPIAWIMNTLLAYFERCAPRRQISSRNPAKSNPT
jgi:hypothetical protein